MKYIIKTILSTLFTLCCLFARADTFVVTSNSDSGPGTLRECITLAAANGIAVKDYIHFNLPGTTLADRTIIIQSELPILSGNLVIDGSTQPSPTLGLSGARVIITQAIPWAGPYIFHIFQLKDENFIEIYGLAIKRELSYSNEAYAIRMENSTNIIIGAPGKGNLINGFEYGIFQKGGLSDKIYVQSNFLGIEEDGETTTTDVLTNGTSAQFENARDVVFGGASPQEGNLVNASGACLWAQYLTSSLTISHNRFGTNYTGTRAIPNTFWSSVNVISCTAEIRIMDNHIVGKEYHGIYMSTQNGDFVIVRNRIGTENTGTAPVTELSYGIMISHSPGKGMIGGSDADQNIIAGAHYGAYVQQSYNVTISKNRMFCNYRGNVQLNWGDAEAGRKAPFVNVTHCDATFMSGDATPNATLELFEVHKCDPNRDCEGRTYLKTITADATGKWRYNFLPGETGFILTATDAMGATSEYSITKAETVNFKVIPAACGKSTGSITGYIIHRGYNPHWEDAAGNFISSDTALINVPAGQYNLVVYTAGCNKPECKVTFGTFYVDEYPPVIYRDWEMITNASCGQKNGGIYFVVMTGMNLRKVWTNAANQEIGRGDNLANIGPGSYYLTLTDTIAGCSATAGPFIISNQDGPTIDISGTMITDASCGLSNGNITGITASGTGTFSYTWKDANGQLAGNQLNLTGVKAGKYVLHYSDESNCASAASDTFLLRDHGTITPAIAAVVITPAGCNAATGAISGIVAPNAETYTWTNANGPEVGRNLPLTNVAAGKYFLLMENSAGCRAQLDFTIPQATPPPVNVNGTIIRHPVCNLSNGSITNIQITGATPAAFRWVNEAGDVISSNINLLNVPAGSYTLYMKDVNQCEQIVVRAQLQTPALPVLNIRQVSIQDDACNSQTGSITGILPEGAAPFTYKWELNGNIVSTAKDILQAKAGTYIMEATDANGCKVQSAPLQVNNNNQALPAPAYPDITIAKGMSAQLKVANPGNGIYHLYRISGNSPVGSSTNGDFNILGLTADTEFMVVLRQGDCTSSPGIAKVKVINETKVYLPSAFSPNGDGVNDVFRIKAFGLSKLTHLTVYNRWGSLVFTTSNMDSGWDGKQNGMAVAKGVYVWFLNGTDLTGTEVKQQGTVTVL